MLDEDYDEMEVFDWWSWSDPSVYYAMGTKHKAFYK
jgi:hypothetical protein